MIDEVLEKLRKELDEIAWTFNNLQYEEICVAIEAARIARKTCMSDVRIARKKKQQDTYEHGIGR